MSPYPLYGVTGIDGNYIRLQEFQLEHSGLSGLTGDDHTNYHTDLRGDSRYLYTGNTDIFSPVDDYNPATKKYVDDSTASSSTTNRVEIDLSFKQLYSNGSTYSEITRVSGEIAQIDTWEAVDKLDKLFTKVITRVSGKITLVEITDEKSLNTLSTNISRLSGNIVDITKTYT